MTPTTKAISPKRRLLEALAAKRLAMAQEITPTVTSDAPSIDPSALLAKIIKARTEEKLPVTLSEPRQERKTKPIARAQIAEKTHKAEAMTDWIVIVGSPLSTTIGGGFEFFGPYTEEEARTVRENFEYSILKEDDGNVAIATQLLKFNER